ncbi:hemopexin repeat-containing protein [Streptomyces sp. NRRL S-1448]|uniref:hemopexin repeat-containing protein n=1 Tax=Streptomyces sp. NRRL S-1448 TaxID=1463883 RepID=UPI000D140852
MRTLAQGPHQDARAGSARLRAGATVRARDTSATTSPGTRVDPDYPKPISSGWPGLP